MSGRLVRSRSTPSTTRVWGVRWVSILTRCTFLLASCDCWFKLSFCSEWTCIHCRELILSHSASQASRDPFLFLWWSPVLPLCSVSPAVPSSLQPHTKKANLDGRLRTSSEYLLILPTSWRVLSCVWGITYLCVMFKGSVFNMAVNWMEQDGDVLFLLWGNRAIFIVMCRNCSREAQ